MAQSKKGKKPTAKTVSKPVATTTAVKPAEQKRGLGSLSQWNKWFGIIYLVQALAILIIATGKTLPVTVHFVGVDNMLSQVAGHTVYATASRHLFDVPLAQVLALALAISGALHWLLAAYMRNQYEEWMAKGLNPVRWLDGAFSASLIVLAIALASGINEITTLIALFVFSFMVHMLGLCMELYNLPYRRDEPVKDRKPYILMVIAAVAVWLMGGIPILAAVLFGNGLPAYIWITYATASVVVVASVTVLSRNYRRLGRWKEYPKAERLHMAISFAAKSIIAWELFVALLRP